MKSLAAVKIVWHPVATMNPTARDRLSLDLPDRTVIRLSTAEDPAALPASTWAYFLVHHNDAGPGDPQGRWRIGASPLRIGRRPPCDVVLADEEVSSAHCELRLIGDDVFVSDIGSTNGTFVDGHRISSSCRLRSGALLRAGRQLLRIEMRDELELQRAQGIDRDIERAGRYVQSLLPLPFSSDTVATEWFFQPSLRVGGDGFGYFALDADHFAGYVVDVSGHGVGAAMHLVAVINALRQPALAGVDFKRPSQVLARLNAMFQMDRHDGMFFTIWYGVYDARSRTLSYASGGHHPAYVVSRAGGPPRPLRTRNTVIGAVAEAAFVESSTVLHPQDRLYLFSDGVFEITPRDGGSWGLEDFLLLPGRPHDPGITEAESLFRTVRAIARPGDLEDDFSLLIVTFM